MKYLISALLLMTSLQVFSQSSYSTAEQDSMRASTQGYDGYANEGIEEQEEDIEFSGEMNDQTSNPEDNYSPNMPTQEDLNFNEQ